MNSSEPVFLHHAFRDKDRVLEVVTVPGHESDAQVLSQRQLAHVGARTVGQHVAAHDNITRRNQRPLVDAGVLVGARILGEVVDIHTRLARHGLVVVGAHHDTSRIDGIDHAATL